MSDTGRRVGRSIGIGLFVIVGFGYLVSGLVVPTLWLVVLNALGAVAFVKTVQWSRDRWWVALVGPVVALVVLVAFVNFGIAVLDWQP